MIVKFLIKGLVGIVNLSDPKILNELQTAAKSGQFLSPTFTLNPVAEAVWSLEAIKFDFSLGNFKNQIPVKNGFLVEIYLSGTNGTLQKLYAKDKIDPITNAISADGFENFFTIKDVQ